MRCELCGLIFIADVPDDLASYYPASYYTLPKSRRRLETLARREHFKLELIRPHQADGDLLEVGPAWGSFALAAKWAGYDVTTVEIDDACCRYLRDEVGVKVYQADLSGDLPPGLDHYDVVALWHVVEHLRDFERTLKTLAGLVRPGGVLVIASPNPGSWQFQIMGERWPHVDAPRHLQLIPPELIFEILSGCGFERALMTFSDAGGLRWNRFGWQRLFLNAMPRTRWATAGGLVFGAAVGAVMAPLDRRRAAGAAYTLILKKAREIGETDRGALVPPLATPG